MPSKDLTPQAVKETVAVAEKKDQSKYQVKFWLINVEISFQTASDTPRTIRLRALLNRSPQGNRVNTGQYENNNEEQLN